MTLDLPLVFAGIMGLAMLLYVVLDGYDLGVGMLVPAATPEEQNRMVNSIGPFWDANETWLVLGIGVLLVAFPAAHGLVLTALYLPVVVMLIGLMLRGAAFEFRIKALGWHRELWNWLFWLGSFLASFAQGFMLGRYITGFESGFGFFLFATVVGAGLCGGYVLLGATWLILRTEGELQKKSIVWARWGLAWTFLGIGLVSLGTPLVAESVREKWFGFPLIFVLMLLPVATLASGIALWRSCGKLARGEPASELAPFAYAALIFVLAFAGLAYSLFPYVVIEKMTIWDAAAHRSALTIVFYGAAVVVPLIAAYTAFSYRVFRGKAQESLYEDAGATKT
jgi:cytochrome bd ubiquinol oxidase subunit II